MIYKCFAKKLINEIDHVLNCEEAYDANQQKNLRDTIIDGKLIFEINESRNCDNSVFRDLLIFASDVYQEIFYGNGFKQCQLNDLNKKIESFRKFCSIDDKMGIIVIDQK